MSTAIPIQPLANPSVPKQRPRLERARDVRAILWERDYEILTVFLMLRLASTAELRALTQDSFEQPFLLWRRLQRLYHAGYLARPPEQQWRLRKNPGNTEHIYSLGSKGARELERLGFKLPKVDWDQKAKDIQAFSFAHPLLVSRDPLVSVTV